MSSYENTSTFQESQKLPLNKDIYNNSPIKTQISEEKAMNDQIIKPIPINIKVIKKPKNELTTKEESSLIIKNVVKELKMPIIYNNYNYSTFAQNGIYIEELNYPKYINNKNIDENNNLFYKHDKPCCSCTKTKCIKKYCECFANNRFCIDCHCQNCMNKLTEINNIQNDNLIEYENEIDKTICTCTKSNCCKKYCECYKINKKCSTKCRCLNCMNMDSQYKIKNKEKEKLNSLNKNKVINNKFNKNQYNSGNKNIISNKISENENIDDNYKIQRISVFINKNHTEINVEKITKEELNLLCKKRKHC